MYNLLNARLSPSNTCISLAAIFRINAVVTIAILFSFFTSASTAEFEDSFTNASDSVKEYCTSSEAFEARCAENEVIVMTSAVYGRMRIGRCLISEGEKFLEAFRDDPTFLGCSVDILQLLDRKCSGVSHCVVRGTLDDDLGVLQPCHQALKSYLEASYRCFPVVQDDSDCTISVTSAELYVVSSASSPSAQNCGSSYQPWKLEAPLGQQISLGVVDFGVTADFGIIGIDDCLEYGHVTDSVRNKSTPLCAAIDRREFSVFSSTSNRVEIIFQWSYVLEKYSTNKKLLVGFKAVGCLDIVAPEEAWMRRTTDEATVGCYTSRRLWYLRCVDGHWVGVIGDCSIEIPELSTTTTTQATPSVNYNEVAVILIIISLTLIICTSIVCVAAICLKRYYIVNLRNNQTDFERTQKRKRYLNLSRENQNVNEGNQSLTRESRSLTRETQSLTRQSQSLTRANQNLS